jgi:hypothetical protein
MTFRARNGSHRSPVVRQRLSATREPAHRPPLVPRATPPAPELSGPQFEQRQDLRRGAKRVGERGTAF